MGDHTRKLERRSAMLDGLTVTPSTASPVLSGYAALTGVSYEVSFYEEILMPGCFKRTLGERPDVCLVLQHGAAGAGLPLARTTGGTLELAEDSTGLAFEARLDPDDPDTQMLRRKLARGDLDGQMSFMFYAAQDEWNKAFTERTIKAAGLNHGDVSVVVHAANSSTSSTWSDQAPRARSLRPARVTVPDYTISARMEMDLMRSRSMRGRSR